MLAPNILVVVVDGLRASTLGAYGNTTFPTPAFDRFAADSFALDWCFAPSEELTVVYDALLRSPAGTLLQRLAADGYSTTLVSDAYEVAQLDVASHFERIVQLARYSDGGDSVKRAGDVSRTSFARLFASASDEIAAASRTSPCLVWVHSSGMYAPWDAPLELQVMQLDEGDPPPVTNVIPPDFELASDTNPDIAFRYATAYSAQTMALDECWQVLMEAIEQARDGERWMVTLLGARGFPLGEHRRVGGIDPRLYAEQLHVPWLIRFPGGLGRLARSRRLTTHSDLASSLMDTLPGSNVRTLLSGDCGAWREALLARSAIGHRVIRTDDWCLRSDANAEATPELFVRPDDRWEANDVAKLCLEVVNALSKKLDEFTNPVF